MLKTFCGTDDRCLSSIQRRKYLLGASQEVATRNITTIDKSLALLQGR